MRLVEAQKKWFSKRMEVTPVVLKDVLYDTFLRTFYCSHDVVYSVIESMNNTIQIVKGIPDVSDVYHVSMPTYAMNYLHYCIGHAYFDTTLSVLSVLHEYDPIILSKRGFQLFVFKDRFQEHATNNALIKYLDTWHNNNIDYVEGTYKGVYQHFHRCFSDSSVIFERSFSTSRYIKFDTFIYGGNVDWQRSIHNSAAKYPGRRLVPVSTDEQTYAWNRIAKGVFGKYIGIKPKQISESPKILFIARRGTREFTPKSLSRLYDTLNTEPTYLESHSFVEQIQMFIDADIIVSAHGSGLYHITWCKPGTRIIEIFLSNDSRKIIFESLSKMAGLDYKRLQCCDVEITTDEPIAISERVYEEINGMCL